MRGCGGVCKVAGCGGGRRASGKGGGVAEGKGEGEGDAGAVVCGGEELGT